MKYVGARVHRQEDPALLTGGGRFIADHKPPGTLHAYFVRSSVGHGRISRIDTAAALELDGVHAIYTAQDLPGVAPGIRLPLHVPNAAIRSPHTQAPLACDEVCFVGEAVAVVIAEDPYVAEDAAELVAVDYAELPAVPDIETAKQSERRCHQDDQDNVAAQFTVGYGDVSNAFASAAHVTRARLRPHRGGGHAMECRGVVAVPDFAEDRLTVFSATQAPHLVKRNIFDCLDLTDEQVRVIAPKDVGGGFGPKAIGYPEEIVIAAVARGIGRPVKWIEDRREHFLCTTQERDQHYDVELALAADGTILGVRGSMEHDTGAYLPWGVIMPYISSTTMPGPYVVPAYSMKVTCYLTNAVPTTPVRGAGRPQAVFAMERLLDLAAAQTHLDRADIRRRNLIPSEAMPYAVGLTYRDGSPVVYDSGDYPETLEAGLAQIDYDGFADRRSRALAEGRMTGIGMAFYVEGTGLGPFEGASIRVEQNGRVIVHTGAAPQGQSHHTVLAQIVADQLEVDLAHIDVVTGDTGTVPIGIGTFASRIAVTAGSSTHTAAIEVRNKALELASELLEVSVDDLELASGAVRVKGAPAQQKTLGELARIAQGMPGFSMPGQTAPGLQAESYFSPTRSTYSHGFHLAEVEVDPKNGRIDILNYVVVHDCGTVINPLVVDGQIQGGLAHGVGNAFLEQMHYDENGQPTTTTFADYLLPEATDVPVPDVVHRASPTDLNPLGAKGAGEGGTIPAAAALVAAVEDAVRPMDGPILHHPLTPSFIQAKAAEGLEHA